MKQLLSSILLLIVYSTSAYADGPEFVASAPEVVVVGENFQVSYTINETCNGEPKVSFGDDFKCLAGPWPSFMKSSTNVNGKRTSVEKTTFTYTLKANEEGKYTIPAATIKSSKGEIKSNTLTIKVLPRDKKVQTDTKDSSKKSKNTPSVSNEDIFVLPILSKTKVYEQEALLLTYKLYKLRASNFNIGSIGLAELPEFKDFQVENVDTKNNNQELENYNGLNYYVYNLGQIVLFPKKCGKLTIPSSKFEVVIEVENPGLYDPFDPFNFYNSYIQRFKKMLVVPIKEITVEPLPKGQPADFSQGVGNFTLKSEISTTNLKANEAVTIKLTLSGNGNIKAITAPKVKFPEDFEVYDPKVEDNYTIKTNGYNGSKVIEYLAIPRSAGVYEIPAVKFSYFDTKSNSYKTLETEKYILQVAKGNMASSSNSAADYTNRQEVKQLGKDIRHIKTGESEQFKRSDILFATKEQMLAYALAFAIFLTCIFVQRKRIAKNANLALLRTKRANKFAVKRLRVAKKMLKAGEKSKFYDETLKALWGYISDKMSIPVSELTKDNIEANLLVKGVDENLVSSFKRLLDECEFAQYAPGGTVSTMDSIYNQAIEIINKMENSIH